MVRTENSLNYVQRWVPESTGSRSDLVKIARTAKPLVCKIIDYGKYRYELARAKKKQRKTENNWEIKEVRLLKTLTPMDLNTK